VSSQLFRARPSLVPERVPLREEEQESDWQHDQDSSRHEEPLLTHDGSPIDSLLSVPYCLLSAFLPEEKTTPTMAKPGEPVRRQLEGLRNIPG
jgi:hypothetical protein